MKKLHKYEIILDDGHDVFKVHTVAESVKAAKAWCEGNGEVVRIKEIPEYLPHAAFVRETLARNGYGEAECDIIYRLLYMYLEGTDEN